MTASGQRRIIWIATGVVCLLLGAIYTIFDPAETVWMPKCPMFVLTGWECPGCGSQRAVHALLHGDLISAFQANAFMILFIPVLGLIAFAELFRERCPRLYRAVSSKVFVLGLLAVVIAWGLVRNLLSYSG